MQATVHISDPAVAGIFVQDAGRRHVMEPHWLSSSSCIMSIRPGDMRYLCPESVWRSAPTL